MYLYLFDLSLLAIMRHGGRFEGVPCSVVEDDNIPAQFSLYLPLTFNPQSYTLVCFIDLFFFTSVVTGPVTVISVINCFVM